MADKYRDVPWKRRLLKIPAAIRASVGKSTTDLVVVAASKSVSDEEMKSGVYRHLLEELLDEGVVSVLPPSDMGPASEKNLNGWSVPRKDLPKITNYTRFWETPNFGDGSRFGYHTHYATQEVWQREYFEAPRAEIEIETLSRGAGKHLVRFTVDLILDRTSEKFDEHLLFNLNLLQENIGTVGLFPSTATKEDYLKTVSLDWTVFPAGTADEVVASFKSRRPQLPPEEERVIRERVSLFHRLKPSAYLQGSGSFGTYFGAQFADDLVVFENLRYGNAMYVLYDDWEEISKRSRIDLIRGTDSGFDRIPHTKGWQDAFRKIMGIEMRKRTKR